MKVETILLIGMIVVLAGCEGQTTYNWYLKNASTSAVQVELESPYGTIDTLEIPSGANQLILTWEQLGGNRYEQDPANYFNDSRVYNSMDTAMKDLEQAVHWASAIDHVRKVPSIFRHDYQITITDQDF